MRSPFSFLLLLIIMSTSMAGNHDLSISTEGKTAVLENHYLQVKVSGLSIGIVTEDGTKYWISTNIKSSTTVDSMTVLKNTRSTKWIELKSKIFSRGKVPGSKYEFLVRLKIHAGSPALQVESELRNLGDKVYNGYFFWKISPARSNVYFSKGQFMVDAPGNIHVEDWAYFPAGKNKTGFGLVLNSAAPGFFMKTIYPHAIWQRLGWYMCRRNDKLPKNKSNDINFIFIPAESLDKFQDIYQNIKKRENIKKRSNNEN